MAKKSEKFATAAFIPTVASETDAPDEDEAVDEEASDWRAALRDAGRAWSRKPSTANLLAVLTRDPEWQGVVSFDEFRGRTFLMRRPPGEIRDDLTYPRELDDAFSVYTIPWIEERYDMSPRPKLVREIMEAVAHAHPHDPLRDHVDSLAGAWDGTARLSTWLSTYLGVPDNDYSRAIGKKFLQGAAARALQPGAKLDNVLVLEGPQAVGKTTVVRTLGDQFFSDEVEDVRDKDTKLGLRGVWFVELAELHALHRNRLPALKRFFSVQEDRYRPPYGTHYIKVPRRVAFVATTNESRYLQDPSGNRRYWPARVSHVDVDALRRDRDQLLGEAAALVMAGEPWVLTDDEEALAQVEQAERLIVDHFAEKVREYIRDRQWDADVVIEEVLGATVPAVELQRNRKSYETRVGRVLKAEGYVRQQTTGGGRVYRRRRLGRRK